MPNRKRLVQRPEPKGEQFWQAHIDSWSGKGMSIRKYCMENGISDSGFYYWKYKFDSMKNGRRCVEPARISDVKDCSLPRHSDQLMLDANATRMNRLPSEFSFVPVNLVNGPKNSGGSTICQTSEPNNSTNQLELTTPGGYRIKVTSDTNLGLLSVLLSALEYQPC